VVGFTPRPLYPRYPIDRFGGPRAGLDDMEKRIFLTLLGLELGPLGRPVRSQCLYRLRYLGSYLLTEMSTRNLPGGKGQSGLKADALSAICEPIV
jgi:hypothetical protein